MNITYLTTWMTTTAHKRKASSLLVTVLAHNTQKEKPALLHASGRGWGGGCTPPRRRRGCFLSSVNIDIITPSPGSQKHESAPRNNEGRTRLQQAQGQAPSLCLVCSSLGRKHVARAAMTNAAREARGPQGSVSLPQTAPNARAPPHPLPGFFFFHIFFHELQIPGIWPSVK